MSLEGPQPTFELNGIPTLPKPQVSNESPDPRKYRAGFVITLYGGFLMQHASPQDL